MKRKELLTQIDKALALDDKAQMKSLLKQVAIHFSNPKRIDDALETFHYTVKTYKSLGMALPTNELMNSAFRANNLVKLIYGIDVLELLGNPVTYKPKEPNDPQETTNTTEDDKDKQSIA